MAALAVLLWVAAEVVPSVQGAGLRVDFNRSGRHVGELLEPSFTPWTTSDNWLPRGVNAISNTFGTVTFTFTRVGRFGSGFDTDWWKEGVVDTNLDTKLVNDGLTVADGNDGAQIEMRISGLTDGLHTLLTYHSTWANPATHTFSPLNIYVDGVPAITNLPVSNRVTNNADAAFSYLQFDATAGRDVVILFQADISNPFITDRNVCIDGFELDVPDVIHQGIKPVVVEESRQAAGGNRSGAPGTGRLQTPVERQALKPLTTIAECLADVRNRSSSFAPVQVTGTVTLVDQTRSLVVLQDDSAAMAIFMPLTNVSLQPGQIVSVQGTGMLPYFRSFPDYPDWPSGRDYQYSLEGPTNVENYCLTWMGGYLHPPVTGQYTFWIAADDAATLWLSPNADPDKAHKTASLAPGDSAGPREWNRHPTQQSQPVELRAGQTYYIEAMGMHAVGPDWLAVAWQGPGIAQSVIDGRYLTPCANGAAGTPPLSSQAAPTNGMLREYWTNFFVRDFGALRTRSPSESMVRIESLRLKVLGTGPLPTPHRVLLGESLRAADNFQWSEIEGNVTFAAAAGNELRLELAGDRSRVSMHVFNWNGKSTAPLEGSRVRIRGVYERIHSIQPDVIGGSFWVPDGRQLTLLAPVEGEESSLDFVLISEIEPSNPRMTWGRRLKVNGRVASLGSDESLLLRGYDIFQGFCSADRTNWQELGKPVEIGMSNSVLVGMAIASHQDLDLATATFDHVEGFGNNWLSADIHARRRGDFKVAGSTIRLTGSGKQIAGDSDQFLFLYQPLDGEGEIEAHLDRFKSADPQAQAGLMIRESLDWKSAYSAVLFSPEQGTKFQCRKNFSEFPVEFVPQPDKPWLKVVRRKNCVLVRPVKAPDVKQGQEVNVVGTLIWEDGTPVLAEASCEPVATQNVRPSEGARVFYGISIEDLLARAQRPSQPYHRGYLEVVRVSGVVTFCDRVLGVNRLFIQDGESGIPLRWADTNLAPSLHVGQLVRASGRTTVGRFPVSLDADGFTVLGWSALPAAAPYSAGHFTAQSRHGQWVEVEGVVRSAAQNGILGIMGKEGLLAAWLGQPPDAGLKQYVNASVRAQGVLSLDGGSDPLLLIPSPEFLEVRESAPPDPFAVPAFSVAALADLNVRPQVLRRMKVTGVVTCVQPKGLFVQDESGGARALTIEVPSVKPGDRAEVVGFPEGHSSVVLSEALVRKMGVGKLPVPVSISPEARDKRRFSGELIRLEGMVLEQRDSREGQLLSLQAGPEILEAALVPVAGEVGRLPAVPVGSRVAVTGVCQVSRDGGIYGGEDDEEAALVTPLRIWLRTPADVAVLQRPPWWTWKHAVIVVGLVSCALLAALIWVRTLRRRVAQRTRELQAATRRLEKEIHTSAVLAERDRLAGEIHDSVEQGLTAIMLQLDAAAKQVDNPEEARRCLGMARSMAGFSRTEVEHAVWDLQSPLLKNADLGAALAHVASEISSGTSPRITVKTVGRARPLPSSVEHHLLRIGQEAITNAVKHAQPQRIQVNLDYSEDELRLAVKDDGNGFVPDAAFTGDRKGHFGLQGIRARARKIDAKLDISSQPGLGTTILVSVALNRVEDPASRDEAAHI